MKNNISILSLTMAIIFISNAVYALEGCETGYACTLKDMQKKEQQAEKNKTNGGEINKPDKNKHQKTKFKMHKAQNYNDIFIFNKLSE